MRAGEGGACEGLALRRPLAAGPQGLRRHSIAFAVLRHSSAFAVHRVGPVACSSCCWPWPMHTFGSATPPSLQVVLLPGEQHAG